MKVRTKKQITVDSLSDKKRGRKKEAKLKDVVDEVEVNDVRNDDGVYADPTFNALESTGNEVPDHPEFAGNLRDASESVREVDESDSSEDEVAPRNTIGDVPLKFYEDEKHIGYDITGKKISKKERQNKLDSFLASADDAKHWRKIYDEYNDEEVELTKEETKIIKRLLQGKGPHLEFDPYAPYVDWFKWDDSLHPLSSAPEPKRRFIPSKWEAKKIVKYVRALRNGLIKPEKTVEEPRLYQLWEDDLVAADKASHLAYIPPPKPKLPGHEESYNPSLEYIPTEEEIKAYQLMDEEDRPKFIPRRFTSIRSIPAYEGAVKENFERCMDLYLCPRVHKKRIMIDPEALKPKLPSRKDLRPYPETCYFEYSGHKGAVVSISLESSGQWIVSGSNDGTVRVWEVETGRCLRIWEIGKDIQCVAWNPSLELPIVAAAAGQDVYLFNTGLGSEETQAKVKELLNVNAPITAEDPAPFMSWVQHDRYDGITLCHPKKVSFVAWHRRGDYFSTLMPTGDSKAILVHRLSSKFTQKLRFKLHGLPVVSVFHPKRSVMFVTTKKDVRAYDLVQTKLIRKLDTGLREISSIAVHSGGDNLIIGSKEGKLCWFDMDLSSKPYKIMKCHPKDVNGVAFHQSYPLFASCSDDCTTQVFHGMVFSELDKNPLIVPLEILRGHQSSNGRGVMDCKFHPRQPWLFTAGADGSIRLYCH